MAQAKDILGQIKLLTNNAQPVLAAEHTTFKTLREVDPSLIKTDAVVARQKRIKRQLGSGATNALTVEHVTETGLHVLQEFDNNPTMARIVTRIETSRSFTFRGDLYDNQFTELSIEFDQDGSKGVVFDGRVPFDETMEAETREEWMQWGVELHYGLTEKGGHYARRVMPNHLGAIAAKLATLEP